MNYLLFDVYDSNKKSKKDIYNNKYIKINECCNDTHSKIFSVNFKYINLKKLYLLEDELKSIRKNIQKSNKKGIKNKTKIIFKLVNIYFLKKKINKTIIKTVNILFKNKYFLETRYIISKKILSDSNLININQEMIKTINEKLQNYKNTEVKYSFKKIQYENTMHLNYMKNLDNYLKKIIKSDKIHTLKVLVIFKNINTFDIDSIKEYINKFKYVDILSYTNSKKEMKIIEEINNEYGTAINILKKDIIDLTSYDIVINYDLLYKEINLYRFKNNIYILNINNIEEDKYNKYNVIYKKYKNKFEKYINIDNYITTELGICFEKYIYIDI